MFPNIQDQFLHAMESDTMDPRAMEGDVHLPEDETKFNRNFTKMSIIGRIPEYGMIYIDIYTYIYTYTYIYRYI